MSEWAVALGAAAVGSFTGGLATLAVTWRSARRQERRHARVTILAEIIPALTSEQATVYGSGSYRGNLAQLLERLREVTATCSRSEERAAALLAGAWRTGVPAGATEPSVVVSEEQCRAIEVHREALHVLIEGRLRPISSRLRPPIKWPS